MYYKSIYTTVMGCILALTVSVQGNTQNRFNHTVQPDWIIGVEYSPFNLDLGATNFFSGEEFYGWYNRKVKQNRFLSTYCGIHIQKRVANQIYLASGVGYSDQLFPFETSQQVILPLYNEKNSVQLNYLHIPLSLNFRQEMGFDKKVGLNINLGILMSYSTHYRVENNLGDFTYYPDQEAEWNFKGGSYWEDGLFHAYLTFVDLNTIKDFPYNEFVRRFLIGGIVEADIFFVLGSKIQLAPGIWYNRDFLTTGSSKNKGFQRWNHEGNVKFYNTRWGVKIKLGYIIE